MANRQDKLLSLLGMAQRAGKLGSGGFAAEQNVTRKKYYATDREWVYDLNDELKYHMYFSLLES